MLLCIGRQRPRGIRSEQARKRDNDIGVPRYEATVKVSKPQKGLNIADVAQFWPIQYRLDLVLIHPQTIDRNVETYELDRSFIPLALFHLSKQPMFP